MLEHDAGKKLHGPRQRYLGTPRTPWTLDPSFRSALIRASRRSRLALQSATHSVFGLTTIPTTILDLHHPILSQYPICLLNPQQVLLSIQHLARSADRGRLEREGQDAPRVTSGLSTTIITNQRATTATTTTTISASAAGARNHFPSAPVIRTVPHSHPPPSWFRRGSSRNVKKQHPTVRLCFCLPTLLPPTLFDAKRPGFHPPSSPLPRLVHVVLV